MSITKIQTKNKIIILSVINFCGNYFIAGLQQDKSVFKK